MAKHTLEPAAQEIADATSKPAFLCELGPDGARKVLDLNQGDNHARTDPDHRARPRRLGRCCRLGKGHPAIAGGRLYRVRPPNLLRGLPQDSAYLHDFLTHNPAPAGQPVVLVGHSYGGAARGYG
jgi:hypothetical protein